MHWPNEHEALVQRLNKPKTNAERQATYREKQRQLGRLQHSFHLTDEEAHYLACVLQQMRKHPTQRPAMMRCQKTGRVSHLDI